MTPEQIRSAILADPELKNLIERGNDEEVCRRLNEASTETEPTGELFTSRGLYFAMGAVAAETVIQKLQALASSQQPLSKVMARVLDWLKPSEAGIDFQNPHAQGLLLTLLGDNIITQQEFDALSSLGARKKVIARQEINDAVRVWRPNGKICPIQE